MRVGRCRETCRLTRGCRVAVPYKEVFEADDTIRIDCKSAQRVCILRAFRYELDRYDSAFIRCKVIRSNAERLALCRIDGLTFNKIWKIRAVGKCFIIASPATTAAREWSIGIASVRRDCQRTVVAVDGDGSGCRYINFVCAEGDFYNPVGSIRAKIIRSIRAAILPRDDVACRGTRGKVKRVDIVIGDRRVILNVNANCAFHRIALIVAGLDDEIQRDDVVRVRAVRMIEIVELGIFVITVRSGQFQCENGDITGFTSPYAVGQRDDDRDAVVRQSTAGLGAGRGKTIGLEGVRARHVRAEIGIQSSGFNQRAVFQIRFIDNFIALVRKRPTSARLEAGRIVLDVDYDWCRSRIAVKIEDIGAEGKGDDVIRICVVGMIEVRKLRVGVGACVLVDDKRENSHAICFAFITCRGRGNRNRDTGRCQGAATDGTGCRECAGRFYTARAVLAVI